MRTSTIIPFLLPVLGFGSSLAVAAGDTCGLTCCDRCGCHAACVQKTCQVVCEMTKETKTSWSVECKEICPLMPGCHHCGDEGPPPPRCGHPKCVKKLVKKEYSVEVPVYKCVVQLLCPDCCKRGLTDSPSTAPTLYRHPQPRRSHRRHQSRRHRQESKDR